MQNHQDHPHVYEPNTPFQFEVPSFDQKVSTQNSVDIQVPQYFAPTQIASADSHQDNFYALEKGFSEIPSGDIIDTNSPDFLSLKHLGKEV